MVRADEAIEWIGLLSPRLGKKWPPGGGYFYGHPSCLFFEGVSGVPRCILHIARGVVGGSLGLIDLPFGFHILVTSELTGTFFDGALCLVGSALHMFAIHERCSFAVYASGQRKGRPRVPRRTLLKQGRRNVRRNAFYLDEARTH